MNLILIKRMENQVEKAIELNEIKTTENAVKVGKSEVEKKSENSKKNISYDEIKSIIALKEGGKLMDLVANGQLMVINMETVTSIKTQKEDLNTVLEVSSKLFNQVINLEKPIAFLLGCINKNGMPELGAITAAFISGELKLSINQLKEGMSGVFDEQSLHQFSKLGKHYPSLFKTERLDGIVQRIRLKFAK